MANTTVIKNRLDGLTPCGWLGRVSISGLSGAINSTFAETVSCPGVVIGDIVLATIESMADSCYVQDAKVTAKDVVTLKLRSGTASATTAFVNMMVLRS